MVAAAAAYGEVALPASPVPEITPRPRTPVLPRRPGWPLSRPWRRALRRRGLCVTPAITVDQGNLGTQATSGSTTSAKATTAIVAAGAMIVALTFTFTSGGATTSHTMSGGGLSWTRAHTLSSGNLRISLHYAFAAAGLASGTSLTHTTAQTSDHTWVMYSLAGVDSASPVRATGGASAATAAWNTGSVSATAGDTITGGAGADGTLRTSTPDSGNTERIDFNSATTSGSITLVDKLSASGAEALSGVWSGAIGHVSIAVAFKPAAGGGGTQTLSPPLVDSGASVFSPTVTPGSVTVSPGLVDSGSSVFSPTVTPGGVTVSPPLVDAGASVFSPAVAPGVVTVAPPLVDAGSSVFSPTVTPGTATISPPLVDSGAAVFTPTVTREGDGAGDAVGRLPILGAG